MPKQRATTYIVEKQAFFAPYLASTLAAANLQVSYTSPDIELGYLVKAAPDVVFIDSDFLTADVLVAIRSVRQCAPQSIICIYSSKIDTDWARDCHIAGANGIFTKFSSREELLAGLSRTLSVGAFTDRRYVGQPVSSLHSLEM